MKASASDSDRAWCKAVASTTAYNAELEYTVRRRGPFYLDRHTGSVQMAATRLLPHVKYVNSSLGYFETEALRPPLSRSAKAAEAAQKPSQPLASQQEAHGPKKRGRKVEGRERERERERVRVRDVWQEPLLICVCVCVCVCAAGIATGRARAPSTRHATAKALDGAQ